MYKAWIAVEEAVQIILRRSAINLENHRIYSITKKTKRTWIETQYVQLWFEIAAIETREDVQFELRSAT